MLRPAVPTLASVPQRAHVVVRWVPETATPGVRAISFDNASELAISHRMRIRSNPMVVLAVTCAVMATSSAVAAPVDPAVGSQPARTPCDCKGGQVLTLGTGLFQRTPFSVGVNGPVYEVCSLDRDGVYVTVDGARHPLWKDAPVRVQGLTIVFVNQATEHSRVCLREVGPPSEDY